MFKQLHEEIPPTLFHRAAWIKFTRRAQNQRFRPREEPYGVSGQRRCPSSRQRAQEVMRPGWGCNPRRALLQSALQFCGMDVTGFATFLPCRTPLQIGGRRQTAQSSSRRHRPARDYQRFLIVSTITRTPVRAWMFNHLADGAATKRTGYHRRAPNRSLCLWSSAIMSRHGTIRWWWWWCNNNVVG